MSCLSIARHDRVDDVVDVDERQLELAVAEHEPAAARVARDRAVDQRDAAAEDLARAQDHARAGRAAAASTTSCSASSFARVYAPRSSGRGSRFARLADRAVAGRARPVDRPTSTRCGRAASRRASCTRRSRSACRRRCRPCARASRPSSRRRTWITISAPLTARSTARRDRRGCRSSTRRRPSGCSGIRRTNTRTRWPSARRRFTIARPSEPDAPVTRNGTLLGQLELREPRRVIGVGRARDLLDPAHDLRRVVDRHRRRLAGREPAVEVGDEVAQALVRLDLLAHELPHADRHVDQRLDRIGERVDAGARPPSAAASTRACRGTSRTDRRAARPWCRG